ncbi:hypothetical protein MPSEU_000188500 [Mayamaea pseudoterrestris]|nr:hypothetical protein MPSEU_000188500 [Mayamaea pseudoterrestris]
MRYSLLRRRPTHRCSKNGFIICIIAIGAFAVAFSIGLTLQLHHRAASESTIRFFPDVSSSRQALFRGESRSLANSFSVSDGHANIQQRRDNIDEEPKLIKPMTNSSASACMLIMDDNHWLVEWLAYHYTTINLRNMIIAIDERSKTSPIDILDRYQGRIEFELWNDSHYFTQVPNGNLQEINLARQQTFLAKCMQTLKLRSSTKWTLFIDTDEFIVLNRRTQQRDSKLFREYRPPLDQPGSLLAFLENEQKVHPETVCHSMGRLQFAPDESELQQVQYNVPAYLNASDFLTFRWLKAAADLIGPKNIADLSAITASDVPSETTYQHRVLPKHCGNVGATWHRRNSLLQIYHYMGTPEQFHFRDDARWSSQAKNKGRNGRYERYIGEFVEHADDLRPWIKGFVSLVGEKEAVRLLEGVGRTSGWRPALAHANRYADPRSIPSEWPPGGVSQVSEDDDDDDDDDGEEEEEDGNGNNQDDVNKRDDDSFSESADDTNDKVKDSTSAIATASHGLVAGSSFYSKARSDRSGAAIADMLLAHAFAFAHGLTYGGACGDAHDQYLNETLNLIKAIGMDDILRFQCPETISMHTTPVIDRKVYFAEKATLWNMHYLASLHSKIKYPDATGRFGVAMHVRRGDVSPCGKYANRYLPNSHYLDVAARYVPPNTSVVVFSELNAFESFDDFRARNYSVQLDTDLAQVWKTIMTADYVVLSKSSFSFIPAMLNPNGTIIYTPFLHPSLTGWKTVDANILRRTAQRMQELQASCVQ